MLYFVTYFVVVFSQNFAVELQLESLCDVDQDYFRNELNRAGGADYGTGVRMS